MKIIGDESDGIARRGGRYRRRLGDFSREALAQSDVQPELEQESRCDMQ